MPIRHFDKKTDLMRVKDFFAQMGGESRALFNQGGWNEKNALAFFDDQKSDTVKNTRYFMAQDNDRMVGYLFLWDMHKSVVWLGIAVSEDWKGRGLGRDLMAHAEEYAKLAGKGGIMLTTSQANIRGLALYFRAGYEHLGTHTSGERLFLKRFDT